MYHNYIITNDIGTTGAKTCIIDEKLRIVESEFFPYDTYYRKENWASQKPLEWWEAVCNNTKMVLERSKITTENIACVGVDGQYPVLVPVGRDKELLINEIPMFSDIRATEQAVKLVSAIGGDIALYKITGSGRQAMLSVCKAMWIRDNLPEIYRKIYKFLSTKDFINLKLTDKLATDYSDLCAGGWMDLEKRIPSTAIFKAVNIDKNKIPDIQESHEVIGYITKEAARTTGLKIGTPVITGAADALCGCIGAGIIKPGAACMSVGSVNWTSVVTEKPFLDPAARVTSQLPLPWPHAYNPLIDTYAGGLSQEWFKNKMYPTEQYISTELGFSIYDYMNRKVNIINPGSDGVIFLPYLKGGGPPYYNTNMRASFIGLGMYHTKEHMLRAIYEGNCFNMRMLFDIFKYNGVQIYNFPEIRAVSGGALSEKWMQCYADILNMKISVVESPRQATAKGVAIMAGVGAGLWDNFEEAISFLNLVKKYKPRKELGKKYLELFKIYKKACTTIMSICDEIALWKKEFGAE